MTLKAFSLKQPWATIVARGLKPVENRSYAPPFKMIGQVFAIHASKTWDKDGERWIRDHFAGDEAVQAAIGDAVLVRSAIIGAARITGYMKADDRLFYTAAGDRTVASPGHELLASPWFFGEYGYTLDQTAELKEPVPCAGALNFWRVPEDLEVLVRGQLDKETTRP